MSRIPGSGAPPYRHLGRSLVAQQVKEIMFSPASLASATVQRDINDWIEEIGHPSRRELRYAIRAVANRRGVQVEAAALRVSTQILAGEEDAVNPLSRSLRLKELIPTAPLHVLPNVGSQVTPIGGRRLEACAF